MSKDTEQVLVIGDAMIDRYIIGAYKQQSPEAPVAVLDFTKVEDRLGGASNVCLNLVGLGMKPILIGIAGDDVDGSILQELCTFNGIESHLTLIANRKTTVKKRFVDASFKQYLRLDIEDRDYIKSTYEDSIKNKIQEVLHQENIKGVIIQDYNKGLLSLSIINFIKDACRKNSIPLTVDPKHDNFYALSECTIFKPNLKELSVAAGKEISPNIKEIEDVINTLKLHNSESIVVTLADKGVFWNKNGESAIIPGFNIPDADVSGAGDTVIATLTYALIKGYDISKQASLANQAGASVCKKPGVAHVNKSEIQA